MKSQKATQRHIQQQLILNISLTQAIHAINHQIVELQFQAAKIQRKHWTQFEDRLLSTAVSVFGTEDLEKLRQVVLSKTKKQIYFRLRYMLENPLCFQNKGYTFLK
ncbi:SANT/Myb_domain [Hexamita inflata]|uniref:SANT/Myb domain n=1 Tax=Hexamita inflata TaxID=28002 RepID=A0AA86QI57_9EUKA|nr:SANT/Myb domain [Hexamita inflata]CAI9959136.1 SANT/Myb domain [Hexamita inflata]